MLGPRKAAARRRRAGDRPTFAVAVAGGLALRNRGGGFGEALLGLDDFPVTEDFGSVFGALITKNVGMASNHFLVDFGDDIGNREAAFFVGDLGVEENLEKKVAKLFGEFGVVGAVQGVEDFVGFLDKVGAESGVGLFTIPGAAIGRAKSSHDGDELSEGWADPWRPNGF